MNLRLDLRMKYLFLGVAVITVAGSAKAACYGTVDEAIEARRSGSLIASVSEAGGYQVTGLRSDPVLGGQWVTIASCEHPEWPPFSRLISRSNFVSAPRGPEVAHLKHAAPVVRAGEVIRLWKQENLLRIETAGVSEENGGLGETIRVRLLHRDAESAAGQEDLYGVVRGPSDVEMQP